MKGYLQTVYFNCGKHTYVYVSLRRYTAATSILQHRVSVWFSVTVKVIGSDAKYLSTKVLKYVLKYYLGT